MNDLEVSLDAFIVSRHSGTRHPSTAMTCKALDKTYNLRYEEPYDGPNMHDRLSMQVPTHV